MTLLNSQNRITIRITAAAAAAAVCIPNETTRVVTYHEATVPDQKQQPHAQQQK
jgi:hypothetical protein